MQPMLASNSCSCHGFPSSWRRTVLSDSGVVHTLSLESVPNGMSHSGFLFFMVQRNEPWPLTKGGPAQCGTALAKPWFLTFVLRFQQKTRCARLTITNQRLHPDSG